jgi:DNA anti-recombination protein RmuC
MKRKHIAISFLAITAFAVGCKPTEQQSTNEQLGKVKTETKVAAQQMKDYAYAQKVDFVVAMRGQLDALNRDLDSLAAKIEASSDAAKAEARPKLQTLRDQVAKLNTQLEKATDATESTWGEVKTGFQKGLDELKDGFQQARQWVSDKVAP